MAISIYIGSATVSIFTWTILGDGRRQGRSVDNQPDILWLRNYLLRHLNYRVLAGIALPCEHVGLIHNETQNASHPT
jgi:hypothetical protein